MSPIKKSAFIRKVKDISVSSSLAVMLLGGLYSCNTASEQEEAYTVGVRTYIAETEKGVFKIMDEEEVAVDSSAAIVTYLDGKRDTLSPQVVKSLIDHEVRNNPQEVGNNHGLSNALLYGGMGYFLARTFSPNYNNLRDRDRSGYYGSSSVMQKSSTIQDNISKSRTVVSKPTGAKSGFMRASGRSSGIS